jgi:hypothetical protein
VNNLVYGNQDPAKIAASVEEIVRKDVGSASPLTYRTVDVIDNKATVMSVLADIGSLFGGGGTNTLLVVELDIPGATPGVLAAQILRQGVGAITGGLRWTFPLAKPVAGEVGIEGHKSFGTPKFTGDAAAAGRLNNAKDLAKKVDKALRTESEMGAVKVTAGRTFSVAPAAGGSTLVIGSLPRLTSMGMSATTDAKDILDIVASIQAAL